MYDTESRLIVTHRIMDDRAAEARRARLAHTASEPSVGYKAHERLGVGHSMLGRVAAALHHATRPVATHRPVFR